MKSTLKQGANAEYYCECARKSVVCDPVLKTFSRLYCQPIATAENETEWDFIAICPLVETHQEGQGDGNVLLRVDHDGSVSFRCSDTSCVAPDILELLGFGLNDPEQQQTQAGFDSKPTEKF